MGYRVRYLFSAKRSKGGPAWPRGRGLSGRVLETTVRPVSHEENRNSVNLREFFAHWAMVASLETIGRSAHNRLMRLARSPEDAQRDALIKIVRLCQDTAQGRRFGLERVRTIDDFRRAVPIQSYED